MALRKKQALAIVLRKQEQSYSQIKNKLHVSKSTLSLWLRDLPLSEKRVRELRDFSEKRIENFRATMRAKKLARLATVRSKAQLKIGKISKREFLIAGLFLYWGEGGKTKDFTTSLSNTDPAMILCFIKWLKLIGVPNEKLRVHMHFYQDMDIESEILYWSNILNLPRSAFRKSYIKKSSRRDIKYFQRFKHGTCNLIVESRDVADFVLQGYDIVRSGFVKGKSL